MIAVPETMIYMVLSGIGKADFVSVVLTTENEATMAMKFINEADWDRALRILAGVVLLYAGWSGWSGTVGLVLVAVGALALVTGIVGWCPAYSLFHVSTKQVAS